MLAQVVGCSHRASSLEQRERLAFSREQTREALDQWRRAFPGVEAVLLSTCNRVELYAATEDGREPGFDQIAGFLARFHGLKLADVADHLYQHTDEAAVRHLFEVASSLDSMVLGEAQIIAQVKDAYQTATEQDATGPLLHSAFQTAVCVARRVARETTIQQRRVSVASVAVVDFASRVFERFDDKAALVIGAGEMAEECLRYLREEHIHTITVVNRRLDRATELAARWEGVALPWERLDDALATADLVVSVTGADEPVITATRFMAVEALRLQRPLLILDLAVPRDFEQAVGDRPNVYLYSIDDLEEACRRNREARDRELPAAMHIVEQETARFVAEMRRHAAGPVIARLRRGWQKPKEEELERLLNKLPELDDHAREEIRRSFDRLVNKLMHPPLESLRDESEKGVPRALLDALAKLFQLKD